MNYVVWDIETDSAQLDWATMIEIGAILLDENFNEKERFTARCRMPQDRVPSATALCINKSNVTLPQILIIVTSFLYLVEYNKYLLNTHILYLFTI